MALFARRHLEELDTRLDGLLTNIGANHPEAAADLIEERISRVVEEVRWFTQKGMQPEVRQLLDEYAAREVPRVGIGVTRANAEAALNAKADNAPNSEDAGKSARWHMAIDEIRTRSGL
jgi:hypothetical protein